MDEVQAVRSDMETDEEVCTVNLVVSVRRTRQRVVVREMTMEVTMEGMLDGIVVDGAEGRKGIRGLDLCLLPHLLVDIH